MPNFNYLKNNESDFPHVGNVDVFKYDNDLDYGRFDYTQMTLQVCTVPWDMGEAHIGNRTISGIGNVVYFETKENRDAWFAAIPDSECYRFETKFKELHRDQFIDVPIPYDMCAKHNYLVVHYSKLANDGSPLQYEGDDGLRDWFWFIREVEFLAPNTTRLHIMDDAFQTWIYDVDVTGMVLERGHAPMFAVSADTYLSNPVENNEYLLTEDVDFGEASQVAHIDALVLNAGDMYACVATTANPTATWGNNVPTSGSYSNNGQPSVYVFAVAAGDINTFLNNVTTIYPQFKQTVQGVFFASAGLLTISNTFTFADVTCHGVTSSRKRFDLCDIDKADFGYASRYAGIAKLYTSPYAHIEITDENGDVDVIRIEDTTGSIDVSAALSVAFPFVTVNAHLLGTGGSATANITFRNIEAHTFDIAGQWYETLRSWNVPTFAVVLDPAREYDYSTRFDRAQRVVDYTTAQANDNANAQNLLDNASTTNTAAAANRDAANTALDANTNNHNNALADANTYNNAKINADAAISTGLNNQITGAQIDLAASSASISAGGTIGSGVVSFLGSMLDLNVGSGVSQFSQSLISASTASSINIQSMTTDATVAGIMALGNDAYAFEATRCNTNLLQATQIENGQIRDTTKALNNSQTANNMAATSGIASNNASTVNANAARNAAAAQSAIDNDIAQAALRAPFIYGSFSDGDSAATKPMALFAHIVTQSKSAIASAGDEFLRYGYRFDKQWDFDGNWNVGRYFTYWKLRDFWVTNLNVPDMYMDKLRFFLFGGVTVWRNPDDIGRRTVYENFNG